MTGFELRNSGIRSNRSANGATTCLHDDGINKYNRKATGSKSTYRLVASQVGTITVYQIFALIFNKADPEWPIQNYIFKHIWQSTFS